MMVANYYYFKKKHCIHFLEVLQQITLTWMV